MDKKITVKGLSEAIKTVVQNDAKTGLDGHIEVTSGFFCVVRNLHITMAVHDWEVLHDNEVGRHVFRWNCELWSRRLRTLHFVGCCFTSDSSTCVMDIQITRRHSSSAILFTDCKFGERAWYDPRVRYPCRPLRIRFSGESEEVFPDENAEEWWTKADNLPDIEDYNLPDDGDCYLLDSECFEGYLSSGDTSTRVTFEKCNGGYLVLLMPERRDQDATTFWTRVCEFRKNNLKSLQVNSVRTDLCFTHGNQIEDLIIKSNRGGKVSFGLSDRVAKSPFYLDQSKEMFILLRRESRERNDLDQEMIISEFIAEISHAIEKKENPWSQERFVMGWRKWLSDFNRSWMRPLSFLLAGHFIFCAIPFICATSTKIGYWEFVTNPFNVTLDYAKSLGWQGTDKEVWGNLIGWFRNIWILMCAIALGNTLKRYKLK